MAWLSRFRAGDLVQVRSQEEILATLDRAGCVDGMPFMPEMLQFCGQRFRVSAVAHKTCDTVKKTGGRRLDATVHLAGARCDGSAHAGCQAECNLFWKDAWLKRIDEDALDGHALSAGCTLDQLRTATRVDATNVSEEPRYSCQATRLHDATKRLHWWDVRQYLGDVLSRNHSVVRVLRVLSLAAFRRVLEIVPLGYRFLKTLYDGAHRVTTKRESPDVEGRIGRGAATPAGMLNLRPGELVRVKPRAEIVATLNEEGKNRGLSFDSEMAIYCGGVFRVHARVDTILDEATGKMLRMKQPCIMLEGVFCKGEYSGCRLLCPRAIPSYWRELWLERVEEAAPAVRADAPAKPHRPHSRELQPLNGSARHG